MAWFGCTPSLNLEARPQASLQVVTDQMTYDAGDPVRIRIVSAEPLDQTHARYVFAVRYLGDDKPVAEGLALGSADNAFPGYRLLWKMPVDARAGRYEVDLRIQYPASSPSTQNIPRVCSFTVYRQGIQVVSTEVSEPYYTSGDTIGCSVKIENLGGRTLSGLRLEFSERYWPWIVQQTQHIGSNIKVLQSSITLKPRQVTAINSSRCAAARNVDQPSIKQYAAVLWDHDRKNVLAIAFTPLVFINPPGVEAPRPYPSQYIYPSLDKVDTTTYRKFHPEPFDSSAIQFDTHHTQFPSGAEAAVKFSIANPSDAAWRQVTVRALLLGPAEKEVARQVLAERLDLNPHGPKLTQEAKFPLPPEANGLFHAAVELADASGQVLASNILELGVNPLPKSVLVFCAHEDDDSTQMGFIRSLVENQIPVRVVYFTSGDAGGCDRYFQHFCGPAEALNFGAIRMQESRAALGHLGVPPGDILFLGLPDGGSGKIWYDHPESSDPYHAVLLASDHAPYEGIVRPNLPFARDAVVDATKKIIKQFQPEVIFTVHPQAEGHIDHIVNNYFVVKALQKLLRDGAIPPEVEVRVDRIFDPKGHPATPYRYEGHEFYVSGETMALAQEAIWYYQSQEGNEAQGNLRTWNQLQHTQGYRKVLDWKEHEGWNEKE
jgi:LmbE family N-acetylglucosaminyl deacetylase